MKAKARARVVEAARRVVENWRKRPHTSKSAQEIKAVQDELERAVDAEAGISDARERPGQNEP